MSVRDAKKRWIFQHKLFGRTAASIGELLKRLDTIVPVTVVEVAAVDLGFDQLWAGMMVQQ